MLANLGIEPASLTSPALQADSLPAERDKQIESRYKDCRVKVLSTVRSTAKMRLGIQEGDSLVAEHRL